MSEPPIIEALETAARRTSVPKVIVGVCVGVILLVAALVAGTRYGMLLPQARVMLEARSDGLKIGRFGKLKVEGLAGDIWRDFTIRRLTIRDEKGVWLQADNVHMTWRYADLLRRRFHADSIDVQTLRLLRRPTLTPKGKDRGNPLSFYIDKARARVEMEPTFSYRRGIYDLNLALDIERRGDKIGAIRAASVLHPGDHLNVDFDVSKSRPILLRADAEEARGGALAGALGLPVDQPFDLKIAALGRQSAGHFTALASSGAVQPLRAAGDWTADGGQAAGRLSLSASRLTAPYARRFGPEAAFVLAGRKAGPTLFALDGRMTAENLAIRAQGLGNLGNRSLGPRGLQVTATSASLSRLTGGPDMGAARAAGVLSQTTTGWRFAGTGSVARAAIGAYSLEQVSGPFALETKVGSLAVTARMSGAGGHGQGWAAGLLGPAPTARLEASKLADGRLLLRRLEVDGKGLKVAASGDRSLLGGLTFKGRVDLPNLAAAHAGAAGAVSATWSAVQGGAGKPWTFGLDARGQKFATGYAELDRLLGAQPRLAANAALSGRRVAVSKADLSGAAGSARAAGVLAADGTATFKLDWNAEGPFRAGPVEISGRARGSGAVTGKLQSPRIDLIADLDAVDLPRLPLKKAHVTLSFMRRDDGSSGLVAANADSAYGPARGRAAFGFPPGGLQLSDLSVDAGGLKASGTLSLRRGAPSAADLRLEITRGAFLDMGRISGAVKVLDASGGPHVSLSLAAENARLPQSSVLLHALRVSADGPLARLPYAASGDGNSDLGRWKVDGRGLLAQTQPGYALTFDGAGRLGSRDVRTAETADIRFGGANRSARVRLVGADGGRIDLSGRLAGDLADVRLELAGVGLGLLDEDLAGRVDATLTAQGRGGRLDGTMSAKLQGARGRGAPTASGIDAAITGRLADNSLVLEGHAANGQGLKADVGMVLPTEASASPFRVAIARQRPLHGRFSAEGEVRPLWDLLVGGERSLSGYVRTEGAFGGTLAAPTSNGTLAVENGRFDDGPTGLTLRQVKLKAAFTEKRVEVTEAAGVDAHGGWATGSGGISLLRDGLSNFRLNLQGFRLIDNEQAVASATGPVTINRTADGKVRLAGDLRIDRADVTPVLPAPSGVVRMDVVEKNRPPELAEFAPVGPTDAGWALDVTLKAPARVFLRGRGLDVELSLDSHVGGTTSHPDLSGVARVVRGDYDFAGKRFQFDTSSVVFLSIHPQNIRLELTATREDPSLTASVRIRGTAAKPEVTLTSSPSLPNDEVLSQVLFGRSASQLSPLEAAQLASAISALAGGGGLDVIGNLRAFARLDRLALGGGDATTGVTVSGGKYLTDKVYLEVTGGGRAGPSAEVEWRIKRNLSILSQIGGQLINQGVGQPLVQNGGRLEIRWKRNY